MPILVGGTWRQADGETFQAFDPASGETLGAFPISGWQVVDEALEAGTQAEAHLRNVDPGQIAGFLDRYADRIGARSDEIVAAAARETALPRSPRLGHVELPRTTDQLRQAARAAEEHSSCRPTISPALRIASMHVPMPGVVCVFGPNNFPLAFNSVSGGDFAAAIATHHPVLAIANPGHPNTTRLLAVEAQEALNETGLPATTVQLIYQTTRDDGFRIVADRSVAASAFTGSRPAGLALKSASDTAGKPIYLEMSSVNPVVILPGAAEERAAQIASELIDSLLLGSGQFCTKPGVIFVIRGAATTELVQEMKVLIRQSTPTPLLTRHIHNGLKEVQKLWAKEGALLAAQSISAGPGWSFPNRLMTVDGSTFSEGKDLFQREAFGNMGLIVETGSVDQLLTALRTLEGNLTGTIYTSTDDADDALYQQIELILRERVGRLLNNKVPTDVAVTPSMHQGGPYPATGHPGFTSVGIPESLRRFGMLQCFDNVPDHRLPPELQAANPLGIQRCIDGTWTRRHTLSGANCLTSLTPGLKVTSLTYFPKAA